jgi:hypothetical protein
MRMLLSRFPEEIVDKYNIKALAVDGWVYIEIRKRNVRLELGWLTGKSTVTKTLGTIWLLPRPAHTRPMVT